MFYTKKYSGGNEPPDCISLDMERGVVGEDAPEEITGCCATCPKGVWGSAVDDDGNPTAGQACKAKKVMLIVQPGDSYPIVLSAPSTSLKPLKKYFGRMVSGSDRPFWSVVTRLGLVKGKSGGGIAHSVIEPEFIRNLSEEETDSVRRLRETYEPSLDKRTPTAEDAE
jgi:hypothetical protein